MALRSAWWMQPPSSAPDPTTQPALPLQFCHRNWPWNQIAHDTYHYSQPAVAKGARLPRRFSFYKSVGTVAELVIFLNEDLCGEAIQALGFYLKISPYFFNFSYGMLNTGTLADPAFFFSLQVMDRYSLSQTPSEAKRLAGSPEARFRNMDGDLMTHTWRVTRITLILKSTEENNCSGLLDLDPLDVAIADGLKVLMTRHEEIIIGSAEGSSQLARISSIVMYIVTFNWYTFLAEAEMHLEALGMKCMDEALTSTEQLQYTRELHRLSPLWVQVRRRLVAAMDLTYYMIGHPLFNPDLSVNGPCELFLRKQIKILEDYTSRCNQLSDETKTLISLIFNIATVQDTRAAIEESKAANAFAASIRRITVLTFVYLPLTLAAITGEETHPAIWIYIVVAMVLLAGTFAAWFLWSQMLSSLERRQKLNDLLKTKNGNASTA
ncbi:uncharacterized protein BDR25DRAFT_380497 [Lindgomyces ingoldianus]|uniref:Uncharacterized protein n=1 Tax=Lindgomyces ingoldianus TaxID=673940 RepID=A0ACB6QDL9_9PLEO|nr:uncharacterized protein BDR25DRAFT_380497 [Lindgomyces ingoldianus]KAF2464708.1 hypothetical protein BDR25DRAFT_380497 [Lindgomyces ingoldianus]